MKLNIKSFALASGIVSAVWALIFHIFVLISGTGINLLEIIITLHPGASMTYLGSIIHAFWMFVYGFICGWVFIWLYNRFVGDQQQ